MVIGLWLIWKMLLQIKRSRGVIDMFELLKIRKDEKPKKEAPKNKKVTEKKTKRTVKDDLAETKEIINQLKAIQKKVSTLKKEGRDNPKLDKLLESISNESYKICLRC